MIILLVVIGIAVGCGLMGAIIGIMIDRYLRDTRQVQADIAEYEKRGRHAKTQPRTTHVRNPATGTWHLPIPGPNRPQPARTSEPGTAILPKHGSIAEALDVAGVRPRLGPFNTTGEQRAITDDFIAAQQADNAAWLEQWSAV